jgi:ABC-type multidrug transport system fused ATPase/permease subunit
VGSHDQLLKDGGRYRDMVMLQMSDSTNHATDRS